MTRPTVEIRKVVAHKSGRQHSKHMTVADANEALRALVRELRGMNCDVWIEADDMLSNIPDALVVTAHFDFETYIYYLERIHYATIGE